MRRAAAIFIVLALSLAACGAADDGGGGDAAPASKSALTVFAAASLTAAFTEADASATYNFAGSQALARQIEDGAPADVFASADEQHMGALVDAGLVDQPRPFARNTLAIAVAAGNPKGIAGLRDLERDDVVLVLADPAVPVGSYARQAFEKAGLPPPEPKSVELDVKATLAKLTLGEADAVVVYTTDVRDAGDAVERVEIPPEHNLVATYPIAVVKATKKRAAAEAFVARMVSGRGQAALRTYGFLPPR
jgi:molybdate transport system substrate-binding protein